MPGRGFATALLLILIALACVAGVRRIERDRRLLAKLRVHGALGPETALRLDRLNTDERDCAENLTRAGVLSLSGNRVYIVQSQAGAFRRRRTRLALSGALIALILAVFVAVLILRR
jgi:spore maturation protein SpmB